MGIYLFIAIIIILILITAQTRVNLANPLTLLWGTWLFSIVVCLCNVFSSYPRLSKDSLLFMASFLVITSVVFMIGHQLPFTYKKVAYNCHRLLLSFNLLFFIVVLAYGVTIIKLGLPPLLSGSTRSTYYLSGGGELLYLLIYPCFFLGLFMLYHKELPYYRSSVILQLMILALIIVTRGNKMAIFSVLLMLCFFWGKKVNLTSIMILLVAVVVIFSLISITYKKNIQDLGALKSAKISLTGYTLPDNLYFLYDPLIYMSSNISNVSGLMTAHLSGVGMGTLSFKGLCQLLAAINPSVTQMMSQSLATANTSLTVSLFSTYSGLGELYFDFGPLIALEIFMLVGFASGLLYKKEDFGLTNNFFAFILFQTLALSFFTFYLGNLEVLTNIAILFFVDMFSRSDNYELIGVYDE